MLDLEALMDHLTLLADEVADSARSAESACIEARTQLFAASQLQQLGDALRRFGQPMAVPIPGRCLDATAPPPEAGDYTVIATDGSQVEPDFHQVAPWFVINTGCALLRYGPPPGRTRYQLASYPYLRPMPSLARNLLLPGEERDADARAAAVSPAVHVEAERLKEELRLAMELVETESDPGRTVLLLDGPLVQWRMLQSLKSDREREAVVAAFRELLDCARESGTVVAGFISRSRAVQWVTLVRASLCPEVEKSGALCERCRQDLLAGYGTADPGAHTAPFTGLRDVELARLHLAGEPEGSRTEVVELQGPEKERLAGGAIAAGFFYLNTGPEIARVEVPEWVWQEPSLLDRLHAVLWDQCRLGSGYPMVLAEAHESAVVRAPDRAAFYTLIERVLAERKVSQPALSAKAASKRRPQA